MVCLFNLRFKVLLARTAQGFLQGSVRVLKFKVRVKALSRNMLTPEDLNPDTALNPRGSIYTTIMELGPERPSPLWFWVPNSTIVVYVDPLGI